MTDLAEKYRPASIEDMLGGEDYKVAVASGVEASSHSWLLVGPSGCGKADDARRIGQYVNRP